MALALLRLLEPRAGRVLIDGVDVATVPLDTLRARLTVVPQDPTLFAGTLRHNLDPTGLIDAEALWTALEMIHMAGWVRALPDRLDTTVAEGGGNLSVGQRQLLCLSRALIRRPRVLVLDEASASVDLETDALVHNTLYDKFPNVTKLIIAHRLNYIFHCDRCLVLDAGRVVEFDRPRTLWSNERSAFRRLADESELPLNVASHPASSAS